MSENTYCEYNTPLAKQALHLQISQPSSEQCSKRERQAQIRSARVRLVPLEQAQGLHGQVQDAHEQGPQLHAYKHQAISASEEETLADISYPRAKSTDVVERQEDVSLASQPQLALQKPMTNALKWQVVAVVAISMALVVLDNTIISVTLPQMQKAFHTDFDTITWVATIYFLTQAAVIPIAGYLSDRIGSILVFLTALTVFTVGSVACALAPTKEVLIASRCLQGIGGGALIPVSTAMVFRIFPHNERGRVAAMIGLPVLMAPAFGPALGGYLSTTFDWNAIFIINIPIGVVALVLGWLVLPGRTFEQTEQIPAGTTVARKGFDILGFLLSMAGFSVLVYGINEAASKGWGDRAVLTFLLIGAVLLLALIVVELRVHDPVLDIRLFKNFTFIMANILMLVVIAVFFGSLFLLPLFFENIQGKTALTTGEFLVIQGLTTGVGVVIAGVLYNRVGPRILSVLGLLFLVAGSYMLTQIDVNTTGESLQVSLALRGFGVGLITTPLQTLSLSVVSNRAMAKASSLMYITRQVITALGLTGLTTYLTQQAITHATDIGNALQESLRTHSFNGAAATCIQAAGPTQNMAAVKACVIQHAATMGLDDTFWITLILSAVCVLLALIVGRDPAIEEYKKAKARGEVVELKRQPSLSE